MDFIKSGWNSVVGSPEGPDQPTVAETIEKLIERVETSTLLEDRRDACRALKSLSKSYRLEVGAQGLNTLISILETDRTDLEIVAYALDALNNIISGNLDDPIDVSPDESPNEEHEDIGQQFTEIFAKKKENVFLMIQILEETDFKVRWPSLKLLMGLIRNKPKDLQECILANPLGVSRLMDLLIDSREIIRNDAILLFVHLTRGNSNIQKIVAFESAFDRLFDIMAGEGFSDGGVVVEDCLIVLQNLLRNNSSNQTFFKEGSYIKRFIPFIDIPESSEWSSQKSTNVLFLLQVIRSLVSPTNAVLVTSSCQRAIQQCGILEKLCALIIANEVPCEILTETINAVAESFRGNNHNQEYFGALTAPTSPPKPIIVVLLMSMVNEKQPFDLRMAVLYCFECFLYKNEFTQAQVVQTLLPNSTEVSGVTSGQLLCGGLFTKDPLTVWFVSTALSHALVDNKTQKEQLLRVQLAIDAHGPPISLLQQCCNLLQSTTYLQSRVGLMMLLSTWCAYCPMAISHFLNIPTNVPYLTSQAGLIEGDEQEVLVQGIAVFLLGICIHFNDDSVPSFTRDDLLQLIKKRVGMEMFVDKLGSIIKHEKYSLAAQKPQLKYRRANDLAFDYEFCKLFRTLESVVLKSVTSETSDPSNGPEGNMSDDQHKLLIQYKNLIREQDMQLTEIRKELSVLKEEHQTTVIDLKELSSTCQQLRDQNALLKASKSSNSSLGNDISMGGDDTLSNRRPDEDLLQQNEQLHKDVSKLTKELNVFRSASIPETKINISDDEGVEEGDSIRDENLKLKEELGGKSKIMDQLKVSNIELCSELECIRKEQEDLLVLLTDQDSKIRDYKKRLVSLGQQVEDEDDFDENFE